MHNLPDPEIIRGIFLECCRSAESNKKHPPMRVQGIKVNATFVTERLGYYRNEIMEMIDSLPPSYQNTSGIVLTPEIEWLLLLGMGIGRVKCFAPQNNKRSIAVRAPYYSVQIKGR